MATNMKPFLYTKGTDETLDQEFATSQKYGKVQLGANHLFWKVGLSRYFVPFSKVQRVYRSLMPMHGRLCAGGYHFDIEYLSLILLDGTQLQMHIGNDVKPKAEALLEAIKLSHPQLEYGRPESK